MSVHDANWSHSNVNDNIYYCYQYSLISCNIVMIVQRLMSKYLWWCIICHLGSVPAGSSDVLEVCPMSGETTCGTILANLEDLTRLGADLHWLPTATPASQALNSHQVDHSDRCSNYVVLAVFPVPDAALSALGRHVNPCYVLRPPERDYSVRLSLASSSSSSSSPLPPIS